MKPGRNDACTCGSGIKYKKCCGPGEADLAQRNNGVTAMRGVRSSLAAPLPSQLRALATLAAEGQHAQLETGVRELLVPHPTSGLLWKLLGLSLWMQGRDAVPALMRAAELLPDDPEAHGNLGNALRAAGQAEKAVASHRRSLALKPNQWQAHNNLGSALLDLGRLDEAIECFRRAAGFNAISALAHSNLGNALLLDNQPDAAESSCRRALEIDPRLTSALVQVAEIQAARGRFDQAQETLNQAVLVEPDMPEAWASMVRLRRMTPSDTVWLAQAQRIVTQALPLRREVPLRYALGKYFDDVGEFPRAFENYRRANDLSNTHRVEQELRQLTPGVDHIIRTHTREWLYRTSSAANLSRQPVFIVGMPRSGTTLAEQILASHAEVHGAGELSFWGKAAAAHGRVQSRIDSQSQLADEPSAVGRLADAYLALLSSLSADAHRVVDKMPGNFNYLGLIHAALPNARILHMRRDPMDTCLSIYFHDFGRAHPYSNDLHDLAAFYIEYSRLMAHWREVLPEGVLLEVPYEALVRDQEAWSRRMLDFIGLPWDPNCLEFHRLGRTVSTHSKLQARQHMSASSIGRWRNYEPFLGPLLTLTEARERGYAEAIAYGI